jgi:Tfp pilus assembly protein PilV
VSNERWYDSDDPHKVVRGGTVFGLSYGVAIVVILAVLSALGGLGALAWNAFISDTKGSLETTARENSTDNRIAAQAFFEDTYAGIQRFDTQLSDAAKALEDWKAANPVPSGESPVDVELYKQELNGRQTTMMGIQQQCRNAVAAYNAEARKTIRDKWRSADLPYQIDNLSPTTDCEVDSTR